MPYETVKLERDGHVATITLNRPERLNAVNNQLRDDLHAALDEVAAQDDIRAVILTGEGRGFCAGADVTGMRARAAGDQEGLAREREARAARGYRGLVQEALPVHIRRIPQPVIAAVNGVAVGMGLGIALSCDIRVASDQARFASIFIKRSITPDNGVSHMLPVIAGSGIAAEMALTGNLYDASWAAEKGIVNKVVSHDALLKEARVYADTIAGNPPIAVRVTKQLLIRGLYYDDLRQSIDNESYFNGVLAQTEDASEAVLSFLEKRQATFKGR